MFDDMNELHSIMDILESIDVGLFVLDRSNNISLWNTFMANHSNKSADAVRDKNLFEVFPETNQDWFRQKIDTAILLKNRAFSTWEQRPYLFKFNHYRPFTSPEPYMFQNLTLLPLTSANGEVHHVCVILYDVTEIATHRNLTKSQNEQLKELARRDSLTDLYIRHYWDQLLETEFLRYSRDEVARTLIMLDIDLLKQINDDYGYGCGDRAIKHVSEQIKKNQRDTDFSARYGGDKFVLLLNKTNESDSQTVANRIHKAIADNSIEHDGIEIDVTVSAGVAELDLSCDSMSSWVQRAEVAMQQAKYQDRNRVIYFSELNAE